jgi:hypothetical protein
MSSLLAYGGRGLALMPIIFMMDFVINAYGCRGLALMPFS